MTFAALLGIILTTRRLDRRLRPPSIGFSTAMTFAVMLALPPQLSAPGDVHRTAAGMFTISYTLAP